MTLNSEHELWMFVLRSLQTVTMVHGLMLALTMALLLINLSRAYDNWADQQSDNGMDAPKDSKGNGVGKEGCLCPCECEDEEDVIGGGNGHCRCPCHCP